MSRLLGNRSEINSNDTDTLNPLNPLNAITSDCVSTMPFARSAIPTLGDLIRLHDLVLGRVFNLAKASALRT